MPLVLHHLHKDYVSELLNTYFQPVKMIVRLDFRKMAVLCNWAWKNL